MRFQPIYDIAELCVRKNVTRAVLCPGSRCAPLTLAFTRHPKISARTFSDERSAGFVALGMAQADANPVSVICTSGTAVYNLAPAVAEAFFSETPLLILTADRPSEWIGQHDGQTIFQADIFGRHVKRYFQLPQDYDHPDSHWEVNRIVNDAINLSRQYPMGPVHINAPFREPLYPGSDETISYSANIRVMEELDNDGAIDGKQKEFIRNAWSSFQHALVVAGQHHPGAGLSASLGQALARHQLPFICDIISNQHGIGSSIKRGDMFLGQASDAVRKTLQPDLLITFGQSMISKNVKLFLRRHAPRAHWHIQPGGVAADTFKHTTTVFQCSPASFFEFLGTMTPPPPGARERENYRKLWKTQEQKAESALEEFLRGEDFGELALVSEVLAHLPDDCNLHLANSMSVRYANYIGLKAEQRGVRVFSNRGTSGIDGCTSTSVGQYLASGKPTFLITGDLAFFYDRNAFWHNYPLPELRILLLNNHGGLIFNMIDGPASMPEAPEYFITNQPLNASSLCGEFRFKHLVADRRDKLKDTLKDFLLPDGRTKILELESDVKVNRSIFDRLKQKIKSSYEL